MQSIQYVCIILLFILSGSTVSNGQSFEGDSWNQIKASGEGILTIAYMEEDFFSYIDDNGNLTGISIDIFDRFVHYLENTEDVRIDVQYVPYSNFSEFYNNVVNAGAGVIGTGSVTISESRKRELTFSPPYFSNIAVLVTGPETPDLTDFTEWNREIQSLTAVAYTGTTHEKRIVSIKNSKLPRLDISYVDSDEEVIASILDSPNRFGYIDLPIFWAAIKADRPLKRHPFGDEPGEKFGFIMPKDSDWSGPLYRFFIGAGFRSSDTYRQIVIRHLGMDINEFMKFADSKNRR